MPHEQDFKTPIFFLCSCNISPHQTTSGMLPDYYNETNTDDISSKMQLYSGQKYLDIKRPHTHAKAQHPQLLPIQFEEIL